MTATLDLLKRRDWVRRSPNPDDRRSTTVQITAEGCATADRLLPSIRVIQHRALSSLTKAERLQLLDLLAKVLESLASIAAEPTQPLTGKRARPARSTGRSTRLKSNDGEGVRIAGRWLMYTQTVQPFLVSQKMRSISAIWRRRSSATATSAVCLQSPAALVAFQNRSCS